MNSFWAERNPRERLMIVVCAVVVVVGVVFALMPSGKGGVATLDAATARLKSREAKAQRLAVTAETTRLNGEVKALAYAEPSDVVVPRVIRNLQTSANTSGIHLREVKPMRPRKLVGLVKIPITVRFTAPFANSVPFLYNVEDPAGKMTVERFTVTASDAKTRMVDVEAQIALFTTSGGLAPTNSTTRKTAQPSAS